MNNGRHLKDVLHSAVLSIVIDGTASMYDFLFCPFALMYSNNRDTVNSNTASVSILRDVQRVFIYLQCNGLFFHFAQWIGRGRKKLDALTLNALFCYIHLYINIQYEILQTATRICAFH